MDWLRLRLARLELDQRVTRERDSLRRPAALGDVMPADGDVTGADGGAAPPSSDVAFEDGRAPHDSGGARSPSDVTPTPCDVTPGDSGASSSSEDWQTEDAATLVTRCRRQRQELRGLKRRLARLERENAALRMRRDPDQPELDPAAIVEDIKQAAAETAAQLEPSGLAYQPETGLYYDHDSGYYWDPGRQMYYDGTSGYYLRYDPDSESYVYEPSPNGEQADADVTSNLTSDVTSDPAEPPRRRRSGEELEEGEIEDDAEAEEGTGAASRAVLEYWTAERMRRARPTSPPDYSAYGPVEPTPAVIQSGPRSPQAVRDPPWLRMIVTETQVDGLRVGSLHVATMDGLTVGRDPSQQLYLADTSLSKFHAIIGYQVEKNDFYIRDLGSRNGTFVDGRRISVAKQESEDTSLPHGCRLRLGSTCLVCHVHAANDTCLDCEPGHTQAPPAPLRPAPGNGDVRQQRRQVADRIKRKYGLRAGDGAAVGASRGYADRAAARRLAKGSVHSAEKTETADVTRAIPAKNKGFQLLQQMGWQAGRGLGAAGQGAVEPISVEERGERRGLGCREPVLPSAGLAEKRKTEVWQKTQERFRKLV
ncbi:angiogenic factor with G patch and FHA domains 1-like isoform X2 [Pollicipes pollicipes]|uniref:angiogenic factor with G patch and FHA domains 1-like isoform X2 n=1 Tax=Pollicipes pollicipes TaxID=41117 RepID=UPI0018856766|nr:angiogenic factor with G patch and FHA domains 1-like isoform X2 [Pollicipes pollicipes]